MYDNVTILLQGLLHKDVSLFDILDNYTKICCVVLSVYRSDLSAVLDVCKSFPQVIIVENNIEEYEVIPLIIDKELEDGRLGVLQNGFFQICTTRKGLSVVHTDYVIKSRVDHYYSNLGLFIEHCFDINKIVISSVFVRGFMDRIHPCRYCLSDCLFMGKTKDIKMVLKCAYNALSLTRPETGLWQPYFMMLFNERELDICNRDHETYVNYIMEYIDVFYVGKLKPYKIKIGGKIEENLCCSNKTTEQYLTTGCDC